MVGTRSQSKSSGETPTGPPPKTRAPSKSKNRRQRSKAPQPTSPSRTSSNILPAVPGTPSGKPLTTDRSLAARKPSHIPQVCYKFSDLWFNLTNMVSDTARRRRW